MWFIKIRKVVPFESVEVFCNDPFLASLFINDLPASLPSSVSCSFYADDLAIWFFSPLVPTAVEATQGAMFQLECWLSTGVFLSIRENVRPPSSQWIPTKLTSSPTSSYSAPVSVSTQAQLFLGSPSIALFPFLNMFFR